MGRNRKPTDQLDRSGQLKARPGRFKDRVREPVCNDALGVPPAGIAASPELFECWSELVLMLEPVKLTAMDRLLVEMATRLMWICRQPNAKSSYFSELMKMMGKFGLTPTDRSRVEGVHSKTQSEEDDVWDLLASEGHYSNKKN